MRNNKSTAAQRSYIDGLASKAIKAGKKDLVQKIFDEAAKKNGNKPWDGYGSVIQFTHRLTKPVCSFIIGELLKI